MADGRGWRGKKGGKNSLVSSNPPTRGVHWPAAAKTRSFPGSANRVLDSGLSLTLRVLEEIRVSPLHCRLAVEWRRLWS